jgi:hypothetical protein
MTSNRRTLVCFLNERGKLYLCVCVCMCVCLPGRAEPGAPGPASGCQPFLRHLFIDALNEHVGCRSTPVCCRLPNYYSCAFLVSLTFPSVLEMGGLGPASGSQQFERRLSVVAPNEQLRRRRPQVCFISDAAVVHLRFGRRALLNPNRVDLNRLPAANLLMRHMAIVALPA